MNRKEFINYGMMGLSASCVLPAASMSSSGKESETIPLAMIEEFVKAGHNDLKKVKAMLKKEPNLIYARHDWGNGDFEEAIEGAGHVVIPALEEYPNLIQTKGPHGFTLLHHVKVGGKDSEDVIIF